MSDELLNHNLEPAEPDVRVGGGGVFINPGTGPVKNTTLTNAVENMKHFIQDCGVSPLQFERAAELDDSGRYGFRVFWTETPRAVTVEMPGLPLERVRYTGVDDQNIWHFPRLYIDGSSWVWMYALLDRDNFIDAEPPAECVRTG